MENSYRLYQNYLARCGEGCALVVFYNVAVALAVSLGVPKNLKKYSHRR